MDLYRTIRDLIKERNRLDAIIRRLENTQSDNPGAADPRKEPKRRGRKGMSDAERREVSERMRKYWEKRRASDTSEATS